MSLPLIVTGGALLAAGVGKQIRDRIAAGAGQRVPRGALPRQFDRFYRGAATCSGIPIEYLRALTKWESNFSPHNTEGAAWGLMEVVPGLLREYNDRNDTQFLREDLLDPELNVRIACWELSRVVRNYTANHRDVFPGPLWTNARFVELVTYGWNAGWSQAHGVGYVLNRLKQTQTASTIRIEDVHRYAAQGIDPVVSRFIAQRPPDWSKKVTRTYFSELRFS